MATDHIEMLYNIGELNGLFEENDLYGLLQRMVNTVADHMRAKVCSIYLYDSDTEELVLKATHGLKQESVNNVRMNINEGLCGLAMREARPVCEEVGSSNPSYKFYPGIDEELFEAFLAVPIIRGRYKIGVMVVQRKKENPFSERDILAMKATASQLATTMENIRLIFSEHRVISVKPKKHDLSGYHFFRGKSASQGQARGKVKQLTHKAARYLKSAEQVDEELALDDFIRAVHETELQLETLQQKVEEKLSDAASLIFASHLLMLKDPGYMGGIQELIEKGMHPVDAVRQIYMQYRDMFLASDNILIREKVQDIEDLSGRVITNMLSPVSDIEEYRGHIIISREIYPSDFLKYVAMDIAGMALVSGGVTSHVSILSRSLRIPLVIISDARLLEVPDDTLVLMDADVGNLYINPTDEIIATFEARDRARDQLSYDEPVLGKTACTADGTEIQVYLNVNLLSDLSNTVRDIVDGIGLYRTEFPFIIRNSFPSEEEQYVIYSKLIESMDGKVVTFRTLDIGGDKVLSYYDTIHEANPFLGMRSIRFSLTHKEIFKQQLRAILRAGAGREIKIMFPMISSIDEFIMAREITGECIGELNDKKIPHCNEPLMGVMVEIPSAVAIIDDLAKESDFLSIGTNDLIQYTLAVDRTNEMVADMYMPHHPAVLRSLKTIADAGIKHGIDVSICGDMGNNEHYIPFLLGIGIRILSVDAVYIPRVKKTINKIDINTAQELAQQVVLLSSTREIEKMIFAGSDND